MRAEILVSLRPWLFAARYLLNRSLGSYRMVPLVDMRRGLKCRALNILASLAGGYPPLASSFIDSPPVSQVYQR